jgi:serine/threonine protein kinase
LKSLKTLKGPPLNLPDRYQFSGSAFSGGQGQVFVCKDSNLERDVAIKVIKPEQDPEIIKTEIASLPTIQSKHVVQVFDVVSDSDRIALVMEYVPGDDLNDYAQTARPLAEFLKALYQIASGIADIHSAGKIHRDIKPNNMKFDQEGIIKIFDFGLSCNHTPPRITTGGRGTAIFRAPELYSDKGVIVTQAVDTYAFAVTAWVLGSKQTLPDAFLEFPPQSKTLAPSIATHIPSLPAEIVGILDRALSVNPANRPAMAEVVAVISRRLLFGQHKGCVVVGGDIYTIDSAKKGSRINVPSRGTIAIHYDGLSFTVSEVAGDVFVNGISAKLNQELPDSCVLIMGAPSSGPMRTFLTFDVSHPEVVL